MPTVYKDQIIANLCSVLKHIFEMLRRNQKDRTVAGEESSPLVVASSDDELGEIVRIEKLEKRMTTPETPRKKLKLNLTSFTEPTEETKKIARRLALVMKHDSQHPELDEDTASLPDLTSKDSEVQEKKQTSQKYTWSVPKKAVAPQVHQKDKLVPAVQQGKLLLNQNKNIFLKVIVFQEDVTGVEFRKHYYRAKNFVDVVLK